LSQSAFNSLANQMSAIVGWDYYRQEWARHKQLLLHIKIGGRPPMSDQAHLRPKHEQTISGNRSRGTRLLPLQKSPSEAGRCTQSRTCPWDHRHVPIPRCGLRIVPEKSSLQTILFAVRLRDLRSSHVELRGDECSSLRDASRHRTASAPLGGQS